MTQLTPSPQAPAGALPEEMRPSRLAYQLLAGAVFAQVAISFVELGVPILAPFIKQGLGLSAAGVGAVVSLLNIGRILGSIPSGQIVDTLGARRVIVYGGVGVGAFAALASLSALLPMVAALVLTGAFAGSSTPAGSKLVFATFPARRRGLPMGIRQAAVPLGALLATASLPAIAQAAGWRAALGFGAIVPLLGAAAAAATIRGRAATAAAAATGATIRGAGTAAAAADAPAGRAGSIRAIARDRRLILAGLWAMMFVGGQYAVLVYLVLDLTSQAHMALGTAVALLAAATGAGAVGRMAWGWLSDRALHGRRRPGLLAATACGIASAALLAALTAGTPTWLAAVAAVLGGFSLLGWQGMWMALVSEMAPAGQAATAIGFGLTFTNTGIVIWPPLFGAIADAAGGFRASWAVLALTLAASLVPLLCIREGRRDRSPRPNPPSPPPSPSPSAPARAPAQTPPAGSREPRRRRRHRLQ